jgi:anti-sigma B factor antagonist
MPGRAGWCLDEIEEVDMELALATREVAGHAVVEVRGEVDVYTSSVLRERLVELIDGGQRRVVVDLDRVDFLDSSGLGVLVGALRRLRTAGGELTLVCTNEKLLKVFRITALDRVFTIHDSVEAATSGAS